MARYSPSVNFKHYINKIIAKRSRVRTRTEKLYPVIIVGKGLPAGFIFECQLRTGLKNSCRPISFLIFSLL